MKCREKQRFGGVALALAAARRRGTALHAYRCEKCGWYRLTHFAPVTISPAVAELDPALNGPLATDNRQPA